MRLVTSATTPAVDMARNQKVRMVFEDRSIMLKMRYSGKGLVCALGCLAGASAHAIVPGNPYETIIAANVFHLVAPAISPPTNQPPLPKIIANGIITILGKRVLFKVQWPARPNEPAREQSYILAQGERAGGIEVLEIDENAATIKFNNNGTVMVLGLNKDAPKPSAISTPVVNTTAPIQPPSPVQAPAESTSLSPEEQIILMEVEREKNKAAVQKGLLPPLPPTPLTPQ